MPVVCLIRTGNWRSVQNALEYLGAEIWLGAGSFTHVVIPGQGSMKSCMEAIAADGWIDNVRLGGIPILGICAGMHAMYDYSEEGGVNGLGWIKGDIRKLPDKRLPRMGWKTTERGDFYFCHSYGNGADFIRQDNLWGCQCHPEKSQQAGLDYLREFLEWRP